MGKAHIIFLSFILWTASVAPSMALLRKDFAAVEGPVLSKDLRAKRLVVRNNADGAQKSFMADDSQLAAVKEGDVVLILHQADTESIGTMVVTVPK